MNILPNALLGALAADAVAMPVHWYYDRAALERDYGKITSYLAPKNPHADSILWRSVYTALNARGDILHDQARYWGQRGVHYHQFLAAGENTLNFQLATRLYTQTVRLGRYDADAWLEDYLSFMLTRVATATPTWKNTTANSLPTTRADASPARAVWPTCISGGLPLCPRFLPRSREPRKMWRQQYRNTSRSRIKIVKS